MLLKIQVSKLNCPSVLRLFLLLFLSMHFSCTLLCCVICLVYVQFGEGSSSIVEGGGGLIGSFDDTAFVLVRIAVYIHASCYYSSIKTKGCVWKRTEVTTLSNCQLQGSPG